MSGRLHGHIGLAGVLFIYHLIRAPWKLDEEHEGRHQALSQKRQELEFDVATLNKKLVRSLENPSGGPEIILEFTPRDGMCVHNVGKGTAHRITVHRFISGNWACIEHQIDYLAAEGGEEFYEPTVESANGSTTLAGRRGFEVFLASEDRARPTEKKTYKAIVPISVTYWDGANKDFFAEFELVYDILTKEIGFPLKHRRIEVRPHPAP